MLDTTTEEEARARRWDEATDFLAACAAAEAMGLRVLPPDRPAVSGSARRARHPRPTTRPFFVVYNPIFDTRQEVYFTGTGLVCSCRIEPWCPHRAAVWEQWHDRPASSALAH